VISPRPHRLGEAGSNAQHSFFHSYQAPDAGVGFHRAAARLHGAAPRRRTSPCRIASPSRRQFAFGHCAAGRRGDAQGGCHPKDIERIGPHRVHEGNRSEFAALIPSNQRANLGELLALYEHSVFVQGTVWGVNSFDQFGVELGQKLAVAIT